MGSQRFKNRPSKEMDIGVRRTAHLLRPTSITTSKALTRSLCRHSVQRRDHEQEEAKRRKQGLRLPNKGVGNADRSGRLALHFTFASHPSPVVSATSLLTMSYEQEPSGPRQVLSLVQFCQRGAS